MSTSIPNIMRYVDITEAGDPKVLQVRERPLPGMADGEVLIKVAGAGLNGADITQRRGKYPMPPGASDIPGLEVSGIIVAVGRDVSSLKEGDEVCALIKGGGYAEYVNVPAPQCMPIPYGVSLTDAGALPETFCTVWTNLLDRGQLKKGEIALIQGGTSGIGYTAIQMAKFTGATVLSTARTDEKCKAVKRFGADRAIKYTEEDFEQVARAFTSGYGVDVVLDIVGGPYIPKELDLLAHDGRLVFVNLRAGKVVKADFGNVHAKHLIVTGSRLRPRSIEEKGKICQALVNDIWPAFKTGDFKIEICARFPFSEAHKAHTLMETSEHIGKILLYPDN